MPAPDELLGAVPVMRDLLRVMEPARPEKGSRRENRPSAPDALLSLIYRLKYQPTFTVV